MTTAAPESPPVASLRLSRTSDDYAALALRALGPPRGGDIWDWCSRHLRMPDGTKWSPRRARLLRRWYRVAQARLSLTPDPADPWAHRCEQLWGCGGAQIAKSTFGHSVMLAAMALYPRSMAYYRARKEDLIEDALTKLKPQLLQTRPLADLLPRGDEARASALAAGRWRVGVSTLLYKCGNVADDMRSITPELILLDEHARYAHNVELTGNPIDSIIVRQITLGRVRLLMGGTTPLTIANHGWQRLCSGSHERLLVACPDCGAVWDLSDERVELTGGIPWADVNPSDITKHQLARYVCRKNGCMIGSAALNDALVQAIDRDTWCPGTWAMDKANPLGAWTPQAELDADGRLLHIPPPETEIRSWWASSLYAEHITLDEYAKLKARAEQGSIDNRQAHTNNHAALPHIIRTDSKPLDVTTLIAGAQHPQPYVWGTCPFPLKWIIGFQDQQGNSVDTSWYPWTVMGFDEPGNGYIITGEKAMNDAEIAMVEPQLVSVRGLPRAIDLWIRDSGNGNLKPQHYLWAAAQPTRRILFYGQPKLAPGIMWREVIDGEKSRKRISKPSGVREWEVAPHLWRTEVWNRLTGKVPGKRILLPANVPKFFAESLTSEEPVEEMRRIPGVGFRPMIVWKARVISSTADKETYREDQHWWDGVVGCCQADDILRRLESPTADVQYGVVATVGDP
jgi:hypothetical protein